MRLVLGAKDVRVAQLRCDLDDCRREVLERLVGTEPQQHIACKTRRDRVVMRAIQRPQWQGVLRCPARFPSSTRCRCSTRRIRPGSFDSCGCDNGWNW